ncbi:type IV pilin [Halocatena marina]|uniref:Type IV pilin n=1 Tax=Halocatena marina TaxID=2934937 RepID=A0ABD5YNY4_9EURY|nr:type IV pilin N-terminal domain-containing protein [Halocatena marina]
MDGRSRTELKQVVFEENRAVSPVIGVILMVAITVILAAVIGAFVLGIGGQQPDPPQTRLDYDFDSEGVVISHSSGDAITRANIDVVVGGSALGEGALESGGSDEKYTAGEVIYSGGVDSGDEIRIIWRNPSGDTTTTLSRTTVP